MRKILKSVYSLLPFKKQLFSFVKLFWIPPHGIYKHLHFTGTIKVKAAPHAFFRMKHYGNEIENEIFWKGLNAGWEKLSMQLWVKLCSDAKVIMDVGANTGMYSLVARAVNPDAKVFAFEPLHRIYLKLQGNCKLNNYDINCIEKALSDNEGEHIIYENDAPHIDAATLEKYTAETYGQGLLYKETIIKTTTLDKVIESENLQRVDLIKIDVETHEPQVMEGFRRHLSLFKPSILVEVLMDEVGEKLQNILHGLGYLYFNIDDKNENIRQVDRMTKSDYFNYLVCSKEKARRLKLIS